MPNDSPNNSLLQTITHMLTTTVSEGTGYDTFINILSLLCLLQILQRIQPPLVAPLPQIASPTNPAANPLQKILGDLTKNMDGAGPSPDILMTLLPLLNNPQVKSKLNSANISNILGLVNNLGGGGINEKKDPPPAATPSPSESSSEHSAPVNHPRAEQEKKDLGSSLN